VRLAALVLLAASAAVASERVARPDAAADRVQGVDVRMGGIGHTRANAIRRLMTTQPGSELDLPTLQHDLARLRSTGIFYDVAERTVLQVDVETSGPASGRWWALNEAVLEKVLSGRLVRLDVIINGTFFTSYAADGVIVSTPTGSTAYSFSARGPIVSPNHRCLLLTPVSPHMLFDRALVLGAHEEVRFVVIDERQAVLTLDGRVLGTLEAGDEVTCTGGPRPARIVTFNPRDFHQILKAKFGLADR